MKKVLAIILVCGMLLSLSGCGIFGVDLGQMAEDVFGAAEDALDGDTNARAEQAKNALTELEDYLNDEDTQSQLQEAADAFAAALEE